MKVKWKYFQSNKNLEHAFLAYGNKRTTKGVFLNRRKIIKDGGAVMQEGMMNSRKVSVSLTLNENRSNKIIIMSLGV